MIPQDFIQQLLARVDIVDVVGRHVQLRRAGSNFLGLCPFHGEKSPSFTVSPSKQFYHCFGCGAHGSAIGFLMEQSGLGYVDAIRDLAREAGMTVPEMRPADAAAAASAASEAADLTQLLADVARFYRQRLRDAPGAIDYLKRRGLTGETAARFGIGYAPAQWRGLEAAVPDYASPALGAAGLVIESSDDDGRSKRYDRFRDRIMFPIRNARGQVIGFGGRVLDGGEPKYMNSPETPVFSKGREIYGLFEAREAIRREDCVIVVEGYMDVVMLSQHGVGNAVATLGTATTPDHVRKLVRLADRLVFAFDGDAAGQRAAWRALGVCLPLASDTRRIDFLFLPPEHDPDSFIQAQGGEAWAQALSQALPLSELLLRELSGQVDLSTPEGRAMLLAQARPMVLELGAPALRMQLVHRLAALTELSVSEVERYLGAAGQPRGSGPSAFTAGRAGSGGATEGAASGPWREASARGGRPERGGRGDEGRGREWGSGAGGGRRGERYPVRVLPRVPVAAPDLEGRVRLLLALHPGLARGLAADEAWIPESMRQWVGHLAGLASGSSFANACEALRALDPAAADRLEREGAADAAALSELSAQEAALELEGAAAQLRVRWARQEVERMVLAGIRTDDERARYQSLLRLSKGLV